MITLYQCGKTDLHFLFVILQKSWDDKYTIHWDKGVGLQYTGTGVEKPLIPTLTTF